MSPQQSQASYERELRPQRSSEGPGLSVLDNDKWQGQGPDVKWSTRKGTPWISEPWLCIPHAPIPPAGVPSVPVLTGDTSASAPRFQPGQSSALPEAASFTCWQPDGWKALLYIEWKSAGSSCSPCSALGTREKCIRSFVHSLNIYSEHFP